MSKFTDTEREILESIAYAYAEDPSPESGRTYCEGEDEYEAAQGLLKRGLLREVESGHYNIGNKWVHFGLTDAGFEAVE